MKNNCWLVAERNLEKKDKEFDSKVSHSFITAIEIKTNIVILKCTKMFIFAKINKKVQEKEIPKILFVSA